MIIPVRCFTCGKVIGNKYNYFIQKVNERKLKMKEDTNKISMVNLIDNNLTKRIEGEVLDEIGCIRMCCRSKIIAHISLIDEI